MRLKLRGFIFDFDGTLADTIPACIAGFRKALQMATGREFTDREVIKEFGASEEGIIRRYADSSFEECLQGFLREYKHTHSGLVPLPGMTEILHELKSHGARLAIVTGKGLPSATISLQHFGLEPLFDAIETGSPDGDVKPERIRKVLKKLNLRPDEAAYIGDAPSDIDGAREAGVLAVAAAWAGSADAAALAGRNPDKLFRTVADFATWARGAVA